MILLRKADERGIVDHGWLLARHTFSFASYFDPRWEQFRVLRVINEDTVQGGTGFGSHPHRDMEIITWILDGALEHRDSMGSHGILRPGDAQVMSAGTGVVHSEVNASKQQEVHLLQTWIFPKSRGAKPSYLQRNFPLEARRDRFCAIASGDGRGDSLPIHQDAVVSIANPSRGVELVHEIGAGRGAWLQVARGAVTVEGHRLAAGDGVGISDATRLVIGAEQDSELMLFDLP
ncbi:MAG: pirin family protein [Planctomycetota bacterium]